MNKSQQIWSSLQDEEYRQEYAADVGTGLAFQIKLIREKNGWTQQALADRVGSHQPTIHQWENPDYGNHTLNSLKSLASAFDLGLMVKFVPFSELVYWNANLTPEKLAPLSFDEEAHAAEQPSRVALATQLGTTFTMLANEPSAWQRYWEANLDLITDLDTITTTYDVRASIAPVDATAVWASGTTVPKERVHGLAA